MAQKVMNSALQGVQREILHLHCTERSEAQVTGFALRMTSKVMILTPFNGHKVKG